MQKNISNIKGKIRVVSGNSNNGRYIRLREEGTKNYNPKELKLLEYSRNFRRTNW